MTRRRWNVALLIALGSVSVMIYELLDGIVPRLALAEPSGAWQLAPWVRSASRSDIPSDMAGISSTAWWFTLAVLGLFVCYLAALLVLRHTPGRSVTAIVFAFAVLFQVQQLDAPALLSSDPFSYLMYGRIASIHHADPYADRPSVYADDPVLPYVYWRDVPSFYGPLWTQVSAVVAFLAGDNVPLGVMLFRLVAAASAVGCGLLIWLVLRVQSAQAATAGAALWLWNPMVPLEAGMSGHNDLLMMALLLAAVWGAQRRKLVLCGACWAGAVFIKVVAALVLPIAALVWLLGDRRPKSLGRSAGLAATGVAVVSVVLMITVRSPMEGAGVGVLGADTERYTNSVHELVLTAARMLMGDGADDVRAPLYYRPWLTRSIDVTGMWTTSGGSRRLIAMLSADSPLLVVAPAENGWKRVFEPPTGRVGYVLSTQIENQSVQEEVTAEPALTAWASRGQHLTDANAMIRVLAYIVFAVCLVVIAMNMLKGVGWAAACTMIFLAFLLATATWIWPWYLLWALGFAALTPKSPLVRLTLVLAGSSLLIYPPFGYQGTEAWWVFNFRSLVVWVLPLVGWWSVEKAIRWRNSRNYQPVGMEQTIVAV